MTAQAANPDAEPEPGRIGGAIVTASWIATVAFAATAIPTAFAIDAFDTAAIAVALGLFALSIPVWLYAFVVGVGRSRTEVVTIGALFFLRGSAPAVERRLLLGALLVSVAVASATASAEPFGVMVPVLPLALCGLWAARYGTFAARPTRVPR